MRHCFFIFDYDNDLSRAHHIEALDLAVATAPAGFDDDADWKAAGAKGDEAVAALIDNAILGTSATVVLIGERTAERDYVDYAIEQSIKRQNGILGVFIHDIPDANGATAAKGRAPYEVQAAEALEAHGYDTHDWDQGKFAEWIEQAATGWKAFARPRPLNRLGA
jgi:hypothetical protein